MFLAGVYAPGAWPYAVRGGFFSGFGADPAWWLALVAVLGLLVCLELAYRAVRRSLIVAGRWDLGGRGWRRWSTWKRALGLSAAGGAAWEEEGGVMGDLAALDVGFWQVMEQDPAVKEALRKASRLGYDQEARGEEDELAEEAVETRDL